MGLIILFMKFVEFSVFSQVKSAQGNYVVVLHAEDRRCTMTVCLLIVARVKTSSTAA